MVHCTVASLCSAPQAAVLATQPTAAHSCTQALRCHPCLLRSQLKLSSQLLPADHRAPASQIQPAPHTSSAKTEPKA